MSTLVPGTYTARAVSAALGLTDSGKEQIAIDFVVLDEGFAGQHITYYGYFTEKTEDRTLESLRYCGWRGDDLTDLSGIDANEVRIECENDTYEGKTRLKVAWVNGMGGLALKTPMTPDQTRAFAARMKAKAAASRMKVGAPPRNDAPPPTDADAPPF